MRNHSGSWLLDDAEASSGLLAFELVAEHETDRDSDQRLGNGPVFLDGDVCAVAKREDITRLN